MECTYPIISAEVKSKSVLIKQKVRIYFQQIVCATYTIAIYTVIYNYGLLVWGGSVCKKELTGLIKIQNQCLKFNITTN